MLDPNGLNNVEMNDSLSNAKNAGGDRVLRWHKGSAGPNPDVSFVEEKDAIPYANSTGWTLAISGADLTGSGLPDVYIANDFGHGHLLYNPAPLLATSASRRPRASAPRPPRSRSCSATAPSRAWASTSVTSTATAAST